MSSIFRIMSRKSTDSQDAVVNSEEINYPKTQNDLDDWKLPKVSNQEIYKEPLRCLQTTPLIWAWLQLRSLP